MHGTNDPLVPFEGGSVHSNAAGPIFSHDSTVNWWVREGGCAGARSERTIADSAGDGTTVTEGKYGLGDQRTEVTDYVIRNGGHTWPGGWQYLPVFMVGKTTRNLDASEVIWAFFQRHAKP
jgi:polyhydroxybutyrate depolymerase